MSTEQPSPDSEEGLLERLGNALVPPEAGEEAIEASPEVDEEAPQDEQPDEQVEPVDDGLVELELDGKTVRVPQEAKDGYLRQSDYTKKTQDLAVFQKQAQAALQTQTLVQQFNEETQELQERRSQINGELKRYKSMDLTNLDTDGYMRTRAYLDQLKDELVDVEKAIGTKAQAVQRKQSETWTTAARNAQDYIQNHVKDWLPDSQIEREAVNFAGSHGITREALADLVVRYPGIAVTLHKAAQYEKLQSAKGAAVQKAQTAPPVVKPGATASTNSAQQKKALDIRSRLKKSGDYRDAAALFMLKGK